MRYTPDILHVFQSLKRYETKHHTLFLASFMLLFFLICDGIVMFFTPISMVKHGITEEQIGLIIGSSSVAGVLIDWAIMRFFGNTPFQRLFLWMFLSAVLFPWVIWRGGTLLWYLFGMLLWAAYYDFYNWGLLDFVARSSKKTEHTANFGIAEVFISLAYVISPLIAGLFGDYFSSGSPFFVAWLMIGISFVFYVTLVKSYRSTKAEKEMKNTHALTLVSGKQARQLVWAMLPALMVSSMLTCIEAVYWTAAPLFSVHRGMAGSEEGFAGLFLFLHEIPAILLGWFVGRLIGNVSNRRAAFISIFVGSLVFLLFFVVSQPDLMLFISFAASVFIGVAWPAINGEYADYISEAAEHEKQIQMFQDSFTNLGFIIGPIMGGFLVQNVGPAFTFGWLGVFGVVLMGLLLFFAPNRISLKEVLKNRK